MVLGNLVAITQTSMKRMLAYSSISQIGYIIIGLVTGNSDGCTSMIVYIFFYIFMGLGTFACVISVSLRTGTDNIRDYEGLYMKDPLLSLSFTLCLLSLGGFPPLTGFFGKLYLFWCGWQSGLYLLVMIALITSILSIYYYLKIIKSMISSKNQLNSYIETCITPSLSFSENKYIEVITFLCALGSTTFGSLTNPIRYFIQDTLGLNSPFLG